MGPVAAFLPDGKRLHLQHGPIDLVVGAEGQRGRAFDAAEARFSAILTELVAELPVLREPLHTDSPRPKGRVAQRMHRACLPFAAQGFVTRMAAVAGSVADEVLAAMTRAADLSRAYVNNGGDIALHLTPGARFRTAMQDSAGRSLGLIEIAHGDAPRGIATSGRHGRSHSLGIADSVTVLADTAAGADVAATVIGNAVDLKDHPAVTRRPACELQEDSDLGDRLVVTDCAPLTAEDRARALAEGQSRAKALLADRGLIIAASLHLQGDTCTAGAMSALEEDSLYA